MASVTVPVVSRLMALVTSSLVSRTATLGSTGTSHARMAAWTWRRASPAAAGPVASRTRRRYSSVGRGGAIAFIGFLSGPVLLVRENAGRSARVLRGPGAITSCSVPLARKMVLQFSVRDIGQLTDLASRARTRAGITIADGGVALV